ncbi:acyl-CoA dehydrogenase family protein [Streptomyces sp. GD-15H]|uniref:acyl-CoA dehydrogenase family protein n=1 Tax=Streptomyces sp. GD-15H TaxID=3129112 RepID=UPI0032511E59
MLSHLSQEQIKYRNDFREFADRVLVPNAARYDADQAIPDDVIADLAGRGYLGALLPAEAGGLGLGMVDYGLLTEELGRACQSIRNFVACQDMVAHSIWKWGTPEHRERRLPGILTGRTPAAFALTEPEVGSDAAAIETTAVADGASIVLRGTKKWISFARRAELFLVFALFEGRHTAFLVDRHTPGLSVEPIEGLLGLRGSMLGRISLEDCRIPATDLLGGPGLGLTFVASSALDIGRYSTAWGSVGLAQACLEACADYVGRRSQYDVRIKEHQLVQRLLADLITDTTATRLLCHHAGRAKELAEPTAVEHTLMAKYRASTVAVQAAAAAVQIHGAQGIGPELPVQRYYRDAKVLEIIEGTTQIQQTLLGRFAARTVQR